MARTGARPAALCRFIALPRGARSNDMEKIKKDIISLLSEDSRLSPASLAAMLGISEAEAKKAVSELEADGVIVKYTAIVNEDLAEDE